MIGEIQEWLDATEGRKEEIIEECVKRLDLLHTIIGRNFMITKKKNNSATCASWPSQETP